MPDDIRFVDFFGERFATPDRFNTRRLMRLATLAKNGVDSEDVEGMAEVDALINHCVRPEDHKRFDDACDRHGPSFEELMTFVMKVVEAVSERPTRRPSDSSDGPTTIEPISTPASSSPALARLDGRPDLQLMVQLAQEARAS